MSGHMTTTRFFTPSEFRLVVETDSRDDNVLQRLRAYFSRQELKYGDIILEALHDENARSPIFVPMPGGTSPATHYQSSSDARAPRRVQWGPVQPFLFLVTAVAPSIDDDLLLEVIKEIDDHISGKKRRLNNGELSQRPLNAEPADYYSEPNELAEEGIALRGVSPNFYMTAADHQIGVGGPGARPIGAKKPKSNDHLFRFFGENSDMINDGSGAGSTVFILDTIPHEGRFASVKGKWSDHERVSTLTYEGLNIEDNPTVNSWHEGAIVGHNYDMSDHGLFAAGIVTSIAPEATIRMIQVLDSCGVGTLESIADGLKLVRDWLADSSRTSEERNQTVVNCSFTLAIPDHPQYRRTGEPGDASQWAQLQGTLNSRPGLGRSAKEQIFSLCDNIFVLGATIVAAAGNEGKPGNQPDPRHPAASTPVIGVGASDMPTRRERRAVGTGYADYSSKADVPQVDGFLTFGGTAVAGKAVEYEAILGLFTADYPDDGSSNTGWAWWAGTSFAAPIVAGATAVLLEHYDRKGAYDFLQSLTRENGGDEPHILGAAQYIHIGVTP